MELAKADPRRKPGQSFFWKIIFPTAKSIQYGWDHQIVFPMKSRTEVLNRVQAKIRLLPFAYSTEQAYCHWAGRYYDFCLTLPALWPAERKAESFLTDLAVRLGVAARTQNQAFAALLFLYKEVIGKPLGQVDALRAKRPAHQRVAPARDQVRQLRRAVEDTPNTPARLLVDLLYGCGLRVSEPLELRVKDLLWDEGPTGQLMLRGAKGGKDRRVPIPAACLAALPSSPAGHPGPLPSVARVPPTGGAERGPQGRPGRPHYPACAAACLCHSLARKS